MSLLIDGYWKKPILVEGYGLCTIEQLDRITITKKPIQDRPIHNKGGIKLTIEFTKKEIEAAFAAYATEKLGIEVDFAAGIFYDEDGEECFVESWELEIE